MLHDIANIYWKPEEVCRRDGLVGGEEGLYSRGCVEFPAWSEWRKGMKL